MAKIITKNIHDKLDSFIVKEVKNTEESMEVQESNKRLIKKNDGLVEKIGGKTLITEDNKQLLND